MLQIPLPTLVDRTADKLIDFIDQHRGFNHLFGSVWGSPDIAAAFEQMKGEMIEGITQLILGKAPMLTPVQAVVRARTLLHLIQGLLPMIEGSRDEERGAAIQELKRAWLAYLTFVIQEATEEVGLSGAAGTGSTAPAAGPASPRGRWVG